MRRFAADTHEAPSYDSFLDIVANLVGILVILIMVIGVGARDAWMAAPPPATAVADGGKAASAEDKDTDAEGTDASGEALAACDEPQLARADSAPAAASADWQQLQEQVESARAEAGRLTRDLSHMDQEIERLAQRVTMQTEEREQLQLMVALAERALDNRRQGFSQREQQLLALHREVDQASAEWARLQAQQETLAAEATPAPVITHYPTPLAKTVFGTEEHFRLLGGRLAYVPIREMTHMLQRDAEKKLWKLENTNQVTEVIGPLEGFRMKYTLHRVERRVSSENGWRLMKSIELQRFVMVPESAELGVPCELALQPASEFAQRLDTYTPGDTTITVWTYPDSFGEFHQLKNYLYERGFVAAARPLPHDYPIGGSPQGSKSAAQ